MADEDEDSRHSKPQKNVRALLRARLEAPRKALADLSNGDLAELVLEELDRRRMDHAGNPTDPDGLFWAVSVGVIGLLAPSELPEEERPKVARLAAVANGVHTLPDGKSSDVIRWISGLAEATWNGEPTAHAEMLAKTLAARCGRDVDIEAVARGLRRKTRAGRAADLAIAAGVLRGPVTDSATRQDALSATKAALQKK